MLGSLRRYWAVDVLAVGVLVAAFGFGSYLIQRQHLADARQHAAEVRAERQRTAICAILANIPGHVPGEIAVARRVFARPGHPHDCQPIPRAVRPRALGPSPAPTTTVLVVVTPGAHSSPSPAATATHSPSPQPTVTVTRTPHPSPTPTCLVPHVPPGCR